MPGTEEKRSEQFYAGGIYAARYENNPSLELDPVEQGILTKADLERLVSLYFRCLWGTFYLLNPTIHTPTYLREVSPFLTTALCATAAMYCPLSSHLVAPLRAHGNYISVRIFAEGYKSVEICQGLLFLVNWAPPANNWVEDRSWVWMGQALRIACEIRLDAGFNDDDFQHLSSMTRLPASNYALLSVDRQRTWSLLFSTELVMSVNTGRLPVTGFLKLPDKDLRPLDPANPAYSYSAGEALDHILASNVNTAVNLLQLGPAASRSAFIQEWKQRLECWRKDWPAKKIKYRSVQLLSISISLRFPGPTREILEEAQESALATLRTVRDVQDSALLHFGNAIVTSITDSMASIQSARIQYLLRKLDQRAVIPDRTASTASLAMTLEPSGFDVNFFDYHNSELFQYLNPGWDVGGSPNNQPAASTSTAESTFT
ncbi:Zn(2)-C6 fungal-type transcription factor [Pseudohyphozyma bogoriensis]|nr:Zn(2)-C6 fungal-type transcription factor [Pseudohyphozyma bogoriensis]